MLAFSCFEVCWYYIDLDASIGRFNQWEHSNWTDQDQWESSTLITCEGNIAESTRREVERSPVNVHPAEIFISPSFLSFLSFSPLLAEMFTLSKRRVHYVRLGRSHVKTWYTFLFLQKSIEIDGREGRGCGCGWRLRSHKCELLSDCQLGDIHMDRMTMRGECLSLPGKLNEPFPNDHACELCKT